jgi:hypothetical protein
MAGPDASYLGGQLNKLLGPGAPIISILEKIEKNGSTGGGKEGGKEGDKDGAAPAGGEGVDMAAMASMATSLTELVKAMSQAKSVDETLGTKIGKVIRDVVESVQDTLEQLDAEKVTAFAALMEAVLGNAGKFMKEMALYAILTPLTMLGVMGFGISVTMLMGILSKAQAVDSAVTEGIATIMGAAKGAFLFGLAMAAWSLLAPLAATGAIAFALVMFGMLAILGLVASSSATTVTALAELMGMATGIALFALAMIGIAFLAVPFAAGTLVFAVVVGVMLLIFGLVAMAAPEVGIAAAALGVISGAAAMLTLSFILIGFFAKQFAVGALTFALTVGLMLLIFGLVAMAVPEIMIAVQAISMIAGVAFKLGLTFVLIGLFAETFAIGALTFALTMGLMLLVFGLVAFAFPEILLAAQAISMMAKPIMLISLTLLAVGFFPKQVLLGGIVASIAIGLLAAAFGVAGLFFPEIYLGAMAVDKMSIPTMLIGAAVLVAGFFPKQIILGAGAVAAAIVLLGGAFALAGIPVIAAAITLGATALGGATIPLMIFAGVLAVVSLFDALDVIAGAGALAGSIILLAGAFAIAGIPMIAGFITLGATALGLASSPLLYFAGVLLALSIAPPLDKDKIDIFASSIITIALGIAQVGLISPLVLLGGTAIQQASFGIMAMTAAVLAFNGVEYSEKTGALMSDMIVSLSYAMLEGFAVLGNPISAYLIAQGSVVMALASFAIGTLAEAVAKIANLEVMSMEIINPGTDKAKLVPGAVRKLKKSDFKAAADNIKLMITSLTGPLMEFGLAVSFGGSLFTKSFMQKGIEMLPIMGDSISTLAMGVAKMANLEVMTTTVINPGTDKAKIVPGETRKLDITDFKLASKNIKAILGSITEPLMEFGKAVDEGDSFFASGYIRKGLEIMPMLSGSIATLAEGVAQMANLEVMTNTVANPGTKDAKLIPGDVRKLDKSDFTAAAENISLILAAITEPLMEFGKAVDEGSDFFSNGYIYTGLDMFGKLSSSMVTLAAGVQSMANMEVITSVVADPGTKDAKLIPGEIIKLDQSHFEAAALNIGAILSNITMPLMEFGMALDQGSSWFSGGYIQTGVEYFGTLSESLGTLAQGVQSMANMEVITNTVADPGTKDAKLIPGEIRKLTEADFKSSATNIAALLSNVTAPLTSFGMALEGGGNTGIFAMLKDAVSPNYMKTGIDGLGTLSESLGTLAQGMVKIANMEFVENVILNPGTKDAKLIPGTIRKVTPQNMVDAAVNIGVLLGSITAPLTKFGRVLSGMPAEGSADPGFLGAATEMLTSMVSPDYMKIGIDGLGTLSQSLGTLADGMIKVARLEFVENIVISPGTKDAKVVPGIVRKVKPQDMKDAAENITYLLGGLFAPLTKFGRALSGVDPDGSAEPGFLGGLGEMFTSMVSPDYMKVGLDGLGTLSESLGTLGAGIIAMASMEVVYNEVVDDGKGGKKIQPMGFIKLNETHFKLAADGVTTILTGLTQPLTDFGRDMEDGAGLFSGGYMQKGLEGLSMLSESLGGLAEGVIKVGSGEFVRQVIINPGTKDAKLIPGEVITLNETHFALARDGIGALLTGLAAPLGEFGKAWKGDGSFFDMMFSDVKAGVEGLAAVSEPIGNLADAIIKLGGGQVVIQEVVKGKLVPGKVLDMTGVLETAKTTLLDILTLFPTAFVASGEYMMENDTTIRSVVGYLENDIIPGMELILEAAGLYSKTITAVDLAAKKNVPVEALILSLDMSMSTLGRTMKRDIDSVALGNFTTFNTQMKRLADIATPFEKFTKAFTQFSKDMGIFGNNFTMMTPNGIHAYKEWTDSMVMISKVDISKGGGIINFIDKTVDVLLGKEPDEDGDGIGGPPVVPVVGGTGGQKPKGQGQGSGSGSGSGPSAAAIAAAIKAALSNLTINNLTVTGTFSPKPSDRRLKENIVRIGTSPSGIAIYEWKYIGIPGRYRGVMAQDLLETEHADAVIMVDGFYRVDYAKLDVKFQSI